MLHDVQSVVVEICPCLFVLGIWQGVSTETTQKKAGRPIMTFIDICHNCKRLDSRKNVIFMMGTLIK